MAECSIVAVCVYYATGTGNTIADPEIRPPGVPLGDCERYEFICTVTSTQIGLVGVMCFFPVLYFLTFCFYLRQAFSRLQSQPYSDFKIDNLLVRLAVSISLTFDIFLQQCGHRPAAYLALIQCKASFCGI